MAHLSEMLSIMVSKEGLEGIKKAASQEDRHISNYVRHLIMADLRDKGIMTSETKEEKDVPV